MRFNTIKIFFIAIFMKFTGQDTQVSNKQDGRELENVTHTTPIKLFNLSGLVTGCKLRDVNRISADFSSPPLKMSRIHRITVRG